MKNSAIEAINLRKQFDKKVAVRDLTLSVDEGEFFGFLGPNGAGKSTTIKMLVGLLRPTAGTARIGGFDVWREPLKAKALLGVLPEGLNLYERLTATEFIRFAGTMYGLDGRTAEQRTGELLQLMDLEEAADKLIVDYSQGMRKKTALAAALIHAPRVLFLDEPFEGIDALSVRAIRQVLERLRRSGTTIFFSSHILEVVQRLCTRIAVINNGDLVAAGTMTELRALAEREPDSTLEDIFLHAVGAGEAQQNQVEALTWLDGPERAAE